MKKGITGIILAGGKNSRMGTDKGLLLIDGKRMVERIASVLKPLVDEIIIITNGHNYDYLGYHTYKDLFRDCGPMGGIYTALQVSKTERNFIVSCDMPFLTEELVQFIIKNSVDTEIALPLHHEKLEPLCAVYDKCCLLKLEELLKSKEWGLQAALKHFTVKQISIPDTLLKENYFTNINTPAEYENQKLNKHEYSN